MEDDKVGHQGKNRKLGTTQIILIAGIVIVVTVLIVVGYFVVSSMNKEKINIAADRVSGKGIVVTAENAKDVAKKMAEPNEMFTTLMNVVWTFADGKTASSDAEVGNNKDNKRPFYFEVILDDSKEVVYTSPIIPVGSKLESLKLDVPLKKGTYSAVCAYNLLDENEAVKSTVSFNVTLQVVN